MRAYCDKRILDVIRNILRKNIVGRLSAQAALKLVMAMELGQRALIEQETARLILSLPMVLCSHVLTRINFD